MFFCNSQFHVEFENVYENTITVYNESARTKSVCTHRNVNIAEAAAPMVAWIVRIEVSTS